jgi:polyferredoxin
LIVIQWLPLFLIPYVLLPYLGHNGVFDAGFGKAFADGLFPAADYAHGREYWRAFGFILAWPLFIWNVFSPKPMVWWLVIGFVQTFVLIPWMIRRWGKGAYCGWICSCGALAETLGDEHRQKMPHGPIWNRVNMLGQAILVVALLLFAARAVSWTIPATGFGRAAEKLYAGLLSGWTIGGLQTNYYWLVDVFLAGIVGVGTYFWFSGRVWCRFACPLAALMNVYTRFSRFRIFADKKKCISCNVCTAVCHQGIDIMNFANKGLAMEDPQCVRCSACVQSCPTGVLSFGYVGSGGLPVYDRHAASPVLRREGGSG